MRATLYVHRRLLLVIQALNQPLLEETEDDSGPPISHVWSAFVRQVKICTVEKPYDQRCCSFNHSLTGSLLSLSSVSKSKYGSCFLQPYSSSLSPLHSTLEERSNAKRCKDSSMTLIITITLRIHPSPFLNLFLFFFISNTHSYTLS